MRWYRFLDHQEQIRYGRDLAADNSIQLLQGDPFTALTDSGRRMSVQQLLAPVEPRAILCIGLNYRQHVGEFGGELPKRPVLFMKNPAAVTGPGAPILLPASCLNPPQVDYEAELAVVIGRAAKNVSAAQALDHVLGYTIGNDVSARRWQKEESGGQWVRGKSFDTFCPLGPALVTPDDLPDPQRLSLSCKINGQLVQDDTTASMIFPVAELIAYLSQDT
ncbi:MAG TPA: fumarylacetoacetate hydrolase family protein, partial [Desulfurivibrionaceae bacterium]|nr:fumarylacetoacetate hydrolase family protein [Desulfurivibrionaceae bacterium]